MFRLCPLFLNFLFCFFSTSFIVGSKICGETRVLKRRRRSVLQSSISKCTSLAFLAFNFSYPLSVSYHHHRRHRRHTIQYSFIEKQLTKRNWQREEQCKDYGYKLDSKCHCRKGG